VVGTDVNPNDLGRPAPSEYFDTFGRLISNALPDQEELTSFHGATIAFAIWIGDLLVAFIDPIHQ
jgi:hypothetical protein